MKKYILSALIFTATGLQTMWAQKLLIYKTDSQIEEYEVSELDSIVFVPIEQKPSYLTCPDENHPHAIDLGLPSGTKWCCCNVCASTPEGFGGYYAWGETSEKDTFTWENYKYCSNGTWCYLTKYCNNPDYGYDYGNGYRYVDNLTELELSDDAARVNMGAPWRMPSYEQQTELWDNCSCRYIEQNGVYGYLFKGTNGGKIFLPAAGYNMSISVGTLACYWARSLKTELLLCDSALCIEIYEHPWIWGRSEYRGSGLSVRAVCP